MSGWAHATAVLVGADGVLISGPSGSGKSSLAAALIGRGARLIADDRTHLSARGGRLVATALSVTAGRLELRGRGLVTVPHEPSAVIRLVVDIVAADALARMPDAASLTTEIAGIVLPRQPVTTDLARALLLVDAALAALAAPQHLRSA